MKIKLLIPALLVLAACNQPGKENTASANGSDSTSSVQGSWKLVSAIKIKQGDTLVTYPEKGQEDEMIKVINADHFAFFKHDLNHGKGKAIYDSGAGTYTLKGDDYTENLQYCNYREWEGHSFNFKVSFKGDSLIQKGIEKIDSLKIDQEIIETYVKLKK